VPKSPTTATTEYSISATNVAAITRGTTSAWTGLTPMTFIASISSRIVLAPKPAHIAVDPAPETTIAVTTGPTCVTDASAAPAPDRSPAPTSSNTMFSVKTMSTV
jgi:hypothetical protein